MGIDKSLPSNSPVVVIDGTVYQCGKIPDHEYVVDGRKPPFPEEWLVEHHSYAKHYYCFGSEQEYRDFLDGLPESDNPPMKANWPSEEGIPEAEYHAHFMEESRRHQEVVAEWMHQLADKKRAERAKEPPCTPEERYRKEARAMIDAVLDRHLHPHEDFDDPEIARQVDLILQDAIRKYREATGWKPLPDQEPLPSDLLPPRLKNSPQE